jgi:hypothetical protein
MSMTLRGMGSHKGDLFRDIHNRFGYRHFTFQQASEIPGFDRAIFFRLYGDKMILRASGDTPIRYRLATRYSKRVRGAVMASIPTPIGQPPFRNSPTTNGEYSQLGGDIV